MTTVAACLGASERFRARWRWRLGLATLSLTALLAAVLVISASRCLFYPLGQDHACALYITDMMMTGRGSSVAIHLKHNPILIAIQWLSVVLFGSSASGLHAFDLCWQLLTMAALIALAGRDGRRWHVGLLAATLYALAYYGLNYRAMGERDGYAVLPLLLMLHALVPIGSGPRQGTRSAWRCFLAGVMGFAAYMLKLPLGLGFGVLWLYVSVEAWRRRREGRSALTDVAGLTTGFLLATLAAGLILIHIGWWDDFSALITTYQPTGYTTGHWMMLELTPRFLLGAGAVAVVILGVVMMSPRSAGPSVPRQRLLVELLPALAAGACVFALFLTVQSWTSWRLMLLRVGGLLLPALGAVLACPWRGRSVVWRMSLLLGCASLVSILLQGKFWYYHFVPLLAFGSYLAACELAGLLRGFNSNPGSTRAWTVVCIAGVASLGLNGWWPRMTAQTAALNVLADCTLENHYARVASHASHTPEYTTALKVSRRVRELTTETDPIVCLYQDTRIYYFSRRPMTHCMSFVNCRGFDQWYPEFMGAIREKRPKVALARIPRDFRGRTDPALIEPIIYNDLESTYGPSAKVIRELYRLAEVIDDVCILQPVAGGNTQ